MGLKLFPQRLGLTTSNTTETELKPQQNKSERLRRNYSKERKKNNIYMEK